MINLSFGDVTKKKISTPNHFISHMIEHIAWRSGLSIELEWENENWKDLGVELGKEIKKFNLKSNQASTLGMIDDGSAVTSIDFSKNGYSLETTAGINKEWFLSLRAEQVQTGKPLLDLFEGLSLGLEARIESIIWNIEDPHHTWEGVFRGIGICLFKLITPIDADFSFKKDQEIKKDISSSEISILESGCNKAIVRRGTAETGITVSLNLDSKVASSVEFEIDKSIEKAVINFNQILEKFALALNAEIKVNFKATVFSSSHVVMEDIGLVLGRALLEIFKYRMKNYGVSGAGSNIDRSEDIQKTVQAAISIEGRKFWRFIPADGNFKKLKENFLINQNILNGLRSEDLDDFIDGLSGGMSSSIMIHINDYSKAEQSWIEVFSALGQALNEAFRYNPYRKGLPPGVKATLA